MRKLLWFLPILLLVGCNEPATTSGVNEGNEKIKIMSCVGKYACSTNIDVGTINNNGTSNNGTNNTDDVNVWIPDGNGEFSYTWDGNACSMPDHTLYLAPGGGLPNVLFRSSTPIAGFQFDVSGTTLIGAAGGQAAAAGMTISTGNNRVIGFSMELDTVAGCGTLVTLVLGGYPSGLSGIVMSDVNGNAISFGQLVE